MQEKAAGPIAVIAAIVVVVLLVFMYKTFLTTNRGDPSAQSQAAQAQAPAAAW